MFILWVYSINVLSLITSSGINNKHLEHQLLPGSFEWRATGDVFPECFVYLNIQLSSQTTYMSNQFNLKNINLFSFMKMLVFAVKIHVLL